MEIVKKNIVLFVFVALSLIISAVLVVLVLQKSKEVKEHLEKVEVLKGSIKGLINEKPAPVESNLEKINADIDGFDGKLKRINKIFGNPYREALQKFASELYKMEDKEKAEEKLLLSWKKHWKKKDRESNEKKPVTPQIILNDFMKKLAGLDIEEKKKKEKEKEKKQKGRGAFFSGKKDDSSAKKKDDTDKKEVKPEADKAKPKETAGTEAKDAKTEAGKKDDTKEEKDKKEDTAAKEEEEGKKGEKGEKDGAEEVVDAKEKQERFQRAFNAFVNTIEKQTVEPLNDTVFKNILLDALGSPRKMSGAVCKTFMMNMKDSLHNLLRKSGIVTDPSVNNFTFSDYFEQDKIPEVKYTPAIIINWKIFEDLVFRLKHAKIDRFSSLVRDDKFGLEGAIIKGNKNFLHFRYTIIVVGSLKSVRSLINQLQEAYKENRVYLVKDILIQKEIDEVEELEDPKARSEEDDEEKKKQGVLKGDTKVIKKMNMEEYQEVTKNYGQPVLGTSNTVKATIVFDYVIYTGSQKKLKKKKKGI